MIRVTVELDQYGMGENIEKLAEVHIANDGTSYDANVGHYNVRSMRKPRFEIGQRVGRVTFHQRKREHVLTLLRKSLEAMGY